MSRDARKARGSAAMATVVACALIGATLPLQALAAEPSEVEASAPDEDTAIPEPTAEDEAASGDGSPAAQEPATSDFTRPPSMTPEEFEQHQRLLLRVHNAEVHYEDGTKLYNRGEYAAAALEYESAYAAIPAANALYSAALSYERAGRPVDAIRTYSEYLALADCASLEPSKRTSRCADEQAVARTALEGQKRLVGELKLAFTEPLDIREVRVAGRTVPLSDFPVFLLPGAVDVELFGTAADQRREWVAYISAGETFTISVSPFDTEVVVRPPELPPDRTDDDEARRRRLRRALRKTFWVGAGLTGASAAALAVMGGLTATEQRTHDDNKCAADCTDENGEPLNTGYPLENRSNFNTYKPVTNALIGVTVGLAVTTALLGVFTFRKENRERAKLSLAGPGVVVRW